MRENASLMREVKQKVSAAQEYIIEFRLLSSSNFRDLQGLWKP